MSARQRPARQRPGSSSPISRLQPDPEPVRVGEHVRETTTEVPESGNSVGTESVTTEVSESGSSERPKFRTLERKDVRLRGDQLDALAQMTRHVAAARTERSERITENTLVRVAIDLLMDHAGQLHGNTETELRQSVSSAVPESESSEERNHQAG